MPGNLKNYPSKMTSSTDLTMRGKDAADESRSSRDKMKIYGDEPDPRARIRIYAQSPAKKDKKT